MPSPRLVLVCALPLLAVLPACQGKGAAPAPSSEGRAAPLAPAGEANAAAGGAAHGGAADPAPVDMADDDGPGEPAVLGPAPTQGPVAALQDDPEKALGAHLVDPHWFRKTLFGEAGTVLDTKRSKADEQGRFSSLIRFELPTMSLDACADHLQGAVKEDVPAVTREIKPDGRIQLSGKTERYEITFLCGQHEGKTIAFVSYQWT
jgi:hypothetical protein